MEKITEREFVDSLELKSASEFFDEIAEVIDEQLRDTIEMSWARVALLIIEQNDDLRGVVRGITAAQWSAFSAGWAMRGLADSDA